MGGMWAAVSPEMVAIFRVITGFSVGCGVPSALTIIAETAPAKERGTLVTACYVAIIMGALWADIGLATFLPNLSSGDWRSLCLWSIIPAAVALPVGVAYLQDTPAYYANKGDFEKMAGVMANMACLNGRSELADVTKLRLPQQSAPEGEAVQQDEGTSGSLMDPKLVPYVVPLATCALLDFAYNFVGFGIAYFLPLELSEAVGDLPLPAAGELASVNALSLFGVAIAGAVLRSDIGHREVLSSTGLLEASVIVLLLFAGSPDGASMLGPRAVLAPLACVLALKIVEKIFSQTVNTVKGELFPSRVRVTALAFAGTCGRTGALLAPALIEETRGAPGSADEFSIFLQSLVVVLLLAVGVTFASLPESKGRPVPE